MNDDGAEGPIATTIQALTWSLAGTGLVVLQVLTQPDLPGVIVLAALYGFCFAIAVLLVVSMVARSRRRSTWPFGRPSVFEWIFAAIMVCFSGALVAAAVVDLAAGGGTNIFLASTIGGLLIVLCLTVGLVRRWRDSR